MRSRHFKLRWVDINSHDGSTKGRSDLDPKSAHTSHTNKHSNVVSPKARSAYGLERSGNRIGYDRQKIEG